MANGDLPRKLRSYIDYPDVIEWMELCQKQDDKDFEEYNPAEHPNDRVYMLIGVRMQTGVEDMLKNKKCSSFDVLVAFIKMWLNTKGSIWILSSSFWMSLFVASKKAENQIWANVKSMKNFFLYDHNGSIKKCQDELKKSGYSESQIASFYIWMMAHPHKPELL